MHLRIALAGLIAVATAAPALAHRLSGTIYCDRNNDGAIDPGDTGIPSVLFRITSLVAAPGDQFNVGADVNGFYTAGLLARSDTYQVQPITLPAGYTVVLPASGTQTANIVSGTPQEVAAGLDFLVQGCAPTTTTSTTSTTTTTTTTSTTTTTTIPECKCPFNPAFLVGSDGRFNNDATIGASLAVNDVGGGLRLGRRLTMADGTTVTAAGVRLAGGASIDNVNANSLSVGPGAVVRGTTGTASLPLLQPFCSVPAITCGSNDVQVPPGQSQGPLAPGTYGRLWVLDGGSITLSPGQFTFCEIKAGRSAKITTLGQATLNVAGSVTIGNSSTLAPAQGTDPILVNVAGGAVRVSDSSMATAAFVAPNARISFGRGSKLFGCFCAGRANSDKRITLDCPKP